MKQPNGSLEGRDKKGSNSHLDNQLFMRKGYSRSDQPRPSSRSPLTDCAVWRGMATPGMLPYSQDLRIVMLIGRPEKGPKTAHTHTQPPWVEQLRKRTLMNEHR